MTDTTCITNFYRGGYNPWMFKLQSVIDKERRGEPAHSIASASIS